eukprot:GHVN01106949.1.p1 GENE.GHVN01106949.1~~GHVN01106949.1.p1  ORF type:complete len:1126 (+),score=206.16 GHVN01106949.1:175-3552(+)
MATPENLDINALSLLLERFLDSREAQNATKEIRSIMSHPQMAVHLTQLMSTHPKAEVRHLSAIFLRKVIVKAWGTLPPEHRVEMKNVLKDRVVHESEHLVRVSIATVLSRVAQISLRDWGAELMAFLGELASSPTAGHREVAMINFHALVEGMCGGDQLREYFVSFAQVFEKGLADPESGRVRLAAVKGLGALTTKAEKDSELASLKSLLKPLAGVVQHALETNSEDEIIYSMEIFDNLLETNGVFADADLPDMVRFCARLGAQKQLSMGVRDTAFNFIHWLANYKPKVLSRNLDLLSDLFDVIISIGAEPDDEADGGADQDEFIVTSSRMAAQCLDSIALNVPTKYVFLPMLEKLQPYTRSSNPLEKRSALVLLGIMSEGCAKAMRKRLDQLLPFVLASFEDSAPEVRSSAGVCLGQMAEFLEPEISNYHDQAFPCLLKAVTTSSDAVKEKVCYSLEQFIDNLDAITVAPYIPVMVPPLLAALNACQTYSARQAVLGSLGGFALAGKGQFEPYVADLLRIVLGGLAYTGMEQSEFRGRCTRVAAVLAQIDSPTFNAAKEDVVKQVLQGFEDVDSYELRESAYRFMSCVAETQRNALVPILSNVLQWVLASLMADDGFEKEYEDEAGGTVSLGDEDDDDEKVCKGYRVHAGFLDEQEAALDCLKFVFENTDAEHLQPYISKIIDSLEQMSKYFHPEIRAALPGVMIAMMDSYHQTYRPPHIVAAAAQLGKDPKDIVMGQDVIKYEVGFPAKTRLHNNTKQLWNESLWRIFQTMLSEDDNKLVMANVMSAIGEILEETGPDLIEDVFDANDPNRLLLSPTHAILKGEHPCQKFDSSSDGVDDHEESRGTEEKLYEGLSTLVSALALALGSQFQPMFALMHPHLFALANHTHSLTYRCIALGCYSEVIRAMGECNETKGFIAMLTPIAINGMKQQEDWLLKRNSCFFVGIVTEVSPTHPTIQERMIEILQALDAVLQTDPEEITQDDEACTVDNAVSAVGRILRSVGPKGLKAPVETVALKFLKCLPLKSDYEENESILKTLVFMSSSKDLQPIVEQNVVDFLYISIREVLNPAAMVPTAVTNNVHDMNKMLLRQLGPQSDKVQELVKVNVKDDVKAIKYIENAFTS